MTVPPIFAVILYMRKLKVSDMKFGWNVPHISTDLRTGLPITHPCRSWIVLPSPPENDLLFGGISGIMGVSGEEMLRIKTTKINGEPMPKQQLMRIEKAFKKQGGIIQRDSETDTYLEKRQAEGITLNDKTILLMNRPSRASVFEELIHSAQYRMGKNDGSYLSRLRCEIEAQEKLIKYAKQYKLTDKEIIQTKNALSQYKNELAEYHKNGGE